MADRAVIVSEDFRPGSLVLIGGRQAKFRGFERGPHGLIAVLDLGRELVRIDAPTMYSRVTLAGRGNARPDQLQLPLSWVWHSLTDAERELLERRARLLLLADTGSRRGLPELDRAEGTLDPRYDPRVVEHRQRVVRLSKDLQAVGDKPWSVSAIYKQLEGFNTHGILSLLHGNRIIRIGLEGLDPDLRAALQEFIDEQPAKPRVNDLILITLASVRLTELGIAHTFSAYELAMIIGELSRGHALHREAKSRDNRADIVGRAFHSMPADRPGQSILIDATATTMFPWFPGLGTGHAFILTAIDVYTRMVVACRVVADAPNSRDVAMLFWDMGRPTVTRAGWPYEYQTIRGLPRFAAVTVSSGGKQAPQPAIGEKLGVWPTFVVVDHGAENESLHLMSAAARNGISLIYCPPGAPWAKGIVESVHRAIDQVQSLFLEAGYKGASVANHPKGADKAARLTLGDLHDALWSYFLGIYNDTEHSGLKDRRNPLIRTTPNQALESYRLTVGEVTIPTDPWRVIDFLSSKPRRLEDYGINVDGLVYQSDELMDLASLVQPGIGVKGHLIDVRHDRYDLSRIFVQHPVTRQWLTVPAVISGGGTAAPFGETLLQAAIDRTDSGGRGLGPTDRMRALATLRLDLSRGIYADAHERRQAAFEGARREAWAHDLEDASPEFRNLVHGVERESAGDQHDEPEEFVDLSLYGQSIVEATA